MKKFLIVLVAVFLTNLGCKKLDNKDRLCACSPTQDPSLILVVKSGNNVDLLNPASNGNFAKDQIQLYAKNAAGNVKQLVFYVRPPFSFGDEKFAYFQLHSSEIVRLAVNDYQDFYLKLGSNEALKLNIEFSQNPPRLISKLLVNGVEASAETGKLSDYVRNVFYVQMP